MKFFSIFLILFGILVILNPDILAYLIGGFFIFIGINMFLMKMIFSKGKKSNFVKFGDYKIFR